MNLKSAAARVANGDLQYMLGRFKTVRRTYSQLRRVGEVLNRGSYDRAGLPTLFPDTSVEDSIRDIRKEAVCFGLRLPQHIVDEIEAFALAEPLHTRTTDKSFYYGDVTRGRTADGLRIPLAGVSDPIRLPAIRAVVEDPVLRSIVRGYLKYEPAQATPLLSWSFASDFTDEERRTLKHHVIDYHYDVGGFNFAYASFYIRDTDRNSGAHVMVKRSHERKPMRMLLGSAVASEADVHRQFGKHNEIMIEGPAGTGFVQDTSCYHKATPPTQRDRLMFAIRFA